MESGHIQLAFGFVPDQNPDDDLFFDLPLNYKKNLLFNKLPYIAQLNNPAIDDVVRSKRTDDISIRKFLLATNLLQDKIQDNLDMIVTNGDFNDASVRRALDTKFPSVMKKPTATNFMFRDKAKFDIQNPVIGTLYGQLLTNKQKEKEELKKMNEAPLIKDLELKKRLDDLTKYNLGIKDDNDDDDDDDDDNNNNNSSSSSSGRQREFRSSSNLPPTLPVTPSSTLSTTQRFLLDGSNKKIAEGIAEATGADGTSTSILKRITFSNTITKIFPRLRELEKINEETSASFEKDKNESDISEIQRIEDISEISLAIEKLKDGDLPSNLEFFCGGEKNEQKLIESATKNVGVLNESNKTFIYYLTWKYGNFILTNNKIEIHLESGQIFQDNNLTGESFYDFLRNQQDLSKKELDIEISVGSDFDFYAKEILSNVVDNQYDLHTNSTSKFLFYNFNTSRQTQRLAPLKIRHSIIANDDFALNVVQSHNWQYFIEALFYISSNETNLDDYNLENDDDFDRYSIIQKTLDNLKYCRNFYERVFDDVSYFFHKKIQELPNDFVEKMEDDLSKEIYYTKKLKNVDSHIEVLKTFNQSF